MRTHYKIFIFSLIILLNHEILPAEKESHYKVIKGDSLYKISEKYSGKGIKWTNIYKLNADKIKDPNLIYPAQQFLLKGFYYKVKEDDSLHSIAKELFGAYDYSKNIYKLNSDLINNPDRIYPGQILFIPGLKAALIEREPAEDTEKIPHIKVIPKQPETNDKPLEITEKAPEIKVVPDKGEPLEESIKLLNNIPMPETFELNRVILSHKADKEELKDFIPPQLSPEDFDDVEVYAGAEMEKKGKKYRKIYITVCDVDSVAGREEFWTRLKNKIAESEGMKGKVKPFNTSKLEGFTFQMPPDKYTFFKEKEKPEVITILKTRIEHEEDVQAFTELFTRKEGILKDDKIKNEIFLLPASLPTGFRFMEFHLEKIPPEYIKKKFSSDWSKKMVGKLNLSAVYLDEENTEWSIQLFNLKTEKEAKIIYDEYFSKHNKEIIKKIEEAKNNSSEDTELFRALYDLSVNIEKIKIGPYKGWLIENKMKRLGEVSYRVSYYIITVSVAGLGRKKTLIELAESLRINEILKNKKIKMPDTGKK